MQRLGEHAIVFDSRPVFVESGFILKRDQNEMRLPTSIQVFNPGSEWHYNALDAEGTIDSGSIDPITFVRPMPTEDQLREAVAAVARAYQITIQTSQVSVANGLQLGKTSSNQYKQTKKVQNEDNHPSRRYFTSKQSHR